MNLIAWVIGIAALVVVLIVLAIVRWSVSKREDDSLHIGDGEVQIVGEQISIAKKLAVIDRWGKALTVIAVVYALTLLGFYLYQGWVQSSGPGLS
ncbi:MAG: hypothetical protein HY822_21955 [Acidobacteria bacterium]|nr:hypothetical protein [Acidobacteriota bacterium]